MDYSVAGRAVMLAAVMPLLISGCADLGPTAVAKAIHSNVVALDLGEGEFQLDIGSRELRHPDGRVVDLKVDETEWLATEFMAQAELANSLSATMTPYNDSGGCDWHKEYCEDATLRTQPLSASLLDPATHADLPNGRGRGDFERMYGKIKIRISRNRPSTALRAAEPVALEFMDGWSCTDVKEAIDAATAEALERRLTLRGLFNKVFGWTGFTLDDGALHGTFGQGSRGAVLDAVSGMETQRVNLALYLLQRLYVQMGCGTVAPAGTTIEPLPGGWEKRCTDVWGTVILPGNQVYTGWYKECEVVRAS